MRILIAATLLAVVAPAETHAKKCATQYLFDRVLKTDAENAVIVVTDRATTQAKSVGTLTLKADGKDAAFDKTALAPGLVVYRLPAGAKKGVVEGANGKVTVTAVKSKAALLPAPKVKTVEHAVKGGVESTIVTTTGEHPASAIALVVTDENDKPLSWGHVSESELVEVYYHGLCSVQPSGTVSPGSVKKVKLFWVDKYGRASAPSPPVTVAQTK